MRLGIDEQEHLGFSGGAGAWAHCLLCVFVSRQLQEGYVHPVEDSKTLWSGHFPADYIMEIYFRVFPLICRN